MKTTRAFLSASLLGVSLFALQGCGQGEYRIPNVPPVVKEKPEEDILGDLDKDDAPTKAPAGDDAPSEKASDKK